MLVSQRRTLLDPRSFKTAFPRRSAVAMDLCADAQERCQQGTPWEAHANGKI
jgi:hypothetical protein